MPIDTRIALGYQPTQIEQPLDAMNRAMTMRQLMLEGKVKEQAFADDQAMRNIYKNHTIIGPDGKAALDQQGAVADALKVNPKLGMQLDQMLRTHTIDQLKAKHDITTQLASRVGDEATYQEFLKGMKQAGMDNLDKLPPSFDPKWWNNYSVHLMDIKDQLDHGLKVAGDARDQEKTNMEYFKTYGKQPPKGYGMPGGASAQPAKSSTPVNGEMGDGKLPALSDKHPAELVPLNIPPSHQAKAFAEIEAAENTAANAPQILKAFDDAANDLHAVDFVPGMQNKDQKAMHALLGPTFKDVEGTVRQAAMDNLYENVTPQVGDSKETIKTKRMALGRYLQSKASAPTARGFGIDLGKFKATSIPDEIINPKDPNAPDTKYIGNLKYVKVDGGWKLDQ